MPLSACSPLPCPSQLPPCSPRRGCASRCSPQLDRAGQNLGGGTVAIEPQQAEDAAGAPADHVELLVSADQVVGEQLRRHMRIREQVVVPQTVGHHGEPIDDGAQAGGATRAQGSRHARCIAALEGLAHMRDRGECQLARRSCSRSPPHGPRETARFRWCRCRDRGRAARVEQPRTLPATPVRSRRRPDPCGWRSAPDQRRSCRPPPGSSPVSGATSAPMRKTRLPVGEATTVPSDYVTPWRCSGG